MTHRRIALLAAPLLAGSLVLAPAIVAAAPYSGPQPGQPGPDYGYTNPNNPYGYGPGYHRSPMHPGPVIPPKHKRPHQHRAPQWFRGRGCGFIGTRYHLRSNPRVSRCIQPWEPTPR
ncbi:MAG: hypothetical protein QM728_11440 [Gordonia sp. (in: high G+C Gram-positive bacteria)]|uniref:hypothetical protein n=1 Tax=Gordonia sp. (in: high G+C Gram-positive bacteria) TaxID=84139 RepID=UPI0039E5130B